MLVRVTRRNGRSSYPRDVAFMKFDRRNERLVYLPTAAREEKLAAWEHGCVAEFDVGEDGQPRSLRLTPATAEERGWKLGGGNNGQRKNLSIPTRDVGVPVPGPSRAVEEVEVSPSEIVVSIPFEFTV